MAQLTARTTTSAGIPVFINTRSQSAGFSGVQRYAIELQRRIGDRVTAVAPRKPMHGLKGHMWEQTYLPTIVRGGLLWSPANSGPLAVKKQVVNVHDVASIDHPEWYSPAFGTWYRWMTPMLIRRAQRVLTLSDFSKQRLLALSRVDESHVVVIPPGVDRRFRPQPGREIERVKAALRIPSSNYILSVGTLEPRKNLQRLLSAWASCVSEVPDDITLVIAGLGGSSRVFSSAQLGAIGPRVHVTGFVSDGDLPALYSGALAFAYVSLYEGFGLPALEAMACGTVPIAAMNTALPEVIGDAGLLIDPFSSEAIAAALKRIISEPELRDRLRTRAIERSRQFSWERTADLTWSVIESVAGCWQKHSAEASNAKTAEASNAKNRHVGSMPAKLRRSRDC